MPKHNYALTFDPDEIRKRIKIVRIEKDFSQDLIAEKMNLSLRTYNRFENMMGIAKRDRIEKFCEITGASYEWIVSGQGERWKSVNGDAPLSVADQQLQYYTDLDDDLKTIIRLCKSNNELKKQVLNICLLVGNKDKK